MSVSPQLCALRAEHLTFRYFENSKKCILKDLSVAFPKGKVSVLMGAGGSGKSTLLNILAGLYPENGGFLSDGRVLLLGEDLQGMTLQDRGRKLSVMFQNPDLQFCMNTLRKEMIFCLENIMTPPEEMRTRIQEVSAWFSIEPLLDQPIHSLSGGEKQKAVLACICLMRTEVLLLDEPFANLDPVWAEKIIGLLQKMNHELGTTIIAIDHALDYWAGLYDTLYVLRKDGTLIEGILPEQLPEYRTVFEAEGLRYPREIRPLKRSAPAGEPVITLRGVSLSTDTGRLRRNQQKRVLLRDASAEFRSGTMTALYGPSGCGKTTLFLTLMKQHRYSGTITVAGKDLKQLREKELFAFAGIVFQNPSHQFVTQNVLTEVLSGMAEPSEEKALALLEEFGLKEKRKLSPYMLSQGQQRRLAVVSILAQGESILFLDEPTYGQDEAMTQAIMTMLRRRVQEENLTVIFTTHDMRLICEWADTCYAASDCGLTCTDPDALLRKEAHT